MFHPAPNPTPGPSPSGGGSSGNVADGVNYGNYARDTNYAPIFAGGDTDGNRQDVDNDNNNGTRRVLLVVLSGLG